MKFCQRCGTRLIFTFSEDWSVVPACFKCGYENVTKNSSSRFSGQTSNEGVIVIGKKAAKLRVLPTVQITCPKCSGKKAYYWTTEIGEDEETIEVNIFRCTMCSHTWRERY